jgi:tetratricopeptide (TPR) repeat protein
MSRRAIKRYEEKLAAEQRVEQEAAVSKVSGDEDSDESLAIVSAPPTKARVEGVANMFSMLLGDEEGEEDEEELTEAAAMTTKMEALAVEKTPVTMLEASGNGAGAGSKRRRKKSKKKGKSKDDDDDDWFVGATAAAASMSEARQAALTGNLSLDVPIHIPDSYFADDDDAELRASAQEILAQVIAIAHPDGIIPGGFEASALKSRLIVAVDSRLLSADAELKRLFGARVVENERREGEQDDPYRRMQKQRGQPSRMRKRSYLVQPRDHWVRNAPGLVMFVDNQQKDTLVGEENVRYFRYVHEGVYRGVQSDYEAVVNTHNPNLLVEIVNRFPFHVDTLLRLAEFYRQTGELERAGEQIEHALFILESSWHRSFKPFDGDCRLSYSVPENRALYTALFWYSQSLTRRGLHRTALECAKLLLNLDPPGDPLGVLMLVDSLALFSGEYDWIRAMHRDYHPVPLEYFPSFAMSNAIGLHCKRDGQGGVGSKVGAGGDGKSRKKKNPSSSSALTQLYVIAEDDENETPLTLLIDALLAFPMVLRPLLVAVKEDSDVWAQYPLFDEDLSMADLDDDGVLLRMSKVYAERSKLLWNAPSNVRLLKDAAVAAGTAHAGGRGCQGEEMAEKGRALRKEAADFLRSSKLYRTLQIADFSSDTATNLPADLLAPEVDDVFGGVDGDGHVDHALGEVYAAIEMFAREDAANRDGARLDLHGGSEQEQDRIGAEESIEAEHVQPPQRQVTTGAAAMAFLESFLPWRDAPAVAGFAASIEDDADNEPLEESTSLWTRLTNALGRRTRNVNIDDLAELDDE